MTLYESLIEAARRYSRFANGQSLTEAWTGLGTENEYRAALRGKYMELVHGKNPRYAVWLKLTPKGAAIVQGWLDQGFDYVAIEAGRQPTVVRALA